MDPSSSIPNNPQPLLSENPGPGSNPDGDSLYNSGDRDYRRAVLKNMDDMSMEEDMEATAPAICKFDAEVPRYAIDQVDAPAVVVNPSVIPANQSATDGNGSSYNSETGDLPRAVSDCIRVMLTAADLEDVPFNGLKYASDTDGTPTNGFDPSPFPTNQEPPGTNPSSSSSFSVVLGSDDDSPYTSPVFFPTVLKYINDMLMEEESEDKPCMLQNSLALQAAEMSFYEVLVQKNPASSDQIFESPGENCAPCSSVDSRSSYNCNPADNMAKSNWVFDLQLKPQSSDTWSLESNSLVPDLLGGMDPLQKFNGVLQNGKKGLLRSYLETEEVASWYLPSQSRPRGRKNHGREDDGYFQEGRSKKHSLASTDESEQLEILDNGFLQKVENKDLMPCPLYDSSRNEASKKFQEEEKLSHLRVKGLKGSREKVDLWTLLTLCAQFAGSGDQWAASEKLKQIRQHSSPSGDANQRLAHYFANGIEGRLAGPGNVFKTPVLGHLTTTADILKAYQLYVSICPFRKMTNFWTNRMIAKEVENRARLHIIDFGIGYGFQWPCFLHCLSTRPGGPPSVKITGIEFPQPGFRPAERVEETGRRLKRMADAFNVPFEYNAIAQKWETISYEDLNIDRDEVIAVASMHRLKNLPDDTMVLPSSRDAVLKLIRKINPDIFIHGVVNGSFNAPFFGTRFREAFFHFSAMFDMFEANVPRENEERLIFEREIIGKDVVNVIACEGFARVERPETYKQWQSRNSRIGFKQVCLDKDIQRTVKAIKNSYHKDFMVDEDGDWFLLGWKGRIIHALSAWKPIPNSDQ